MSERLVRMLRMRVAPADGVADAELLARWADRRDEAAFELLLRRHAEPVWRVCRAVAGAGAEDAFQATFLALARRAGAVRGNVPGWLHTVARHASHRARRFVGRAVPDIGNVADVGPRPPHEGVAPLHEELARLPDAYRLPVLLCHLHGRTQAEAARELGLPLGTVATRVRRGCDRLRVALTRRGVAPVVGFGPPLVLPAALIPAALGVGLGATSALPAIQTLAHGAVSAMSRTKLRATLAALTVGCAVTGGAILARQPAADPPKPAAQPAAVVGALKTSDYFLRTTAERRLKQVVDAWYKCEANSPTAPTDIVGNDGRPLLSWRVAILQELDQELLYSLFKLDEPWDSPHNIALLKHIPRPYQGPGLGGRQHGETRTKAFRGPRALLDPAGKLTFDEYYRVDHARFAGFAEAGAPLPWTKPGDLDYAADKPLPDLSGPFADRVAVALMDRSVRCVPRVLPEGVWRRLIDRTNKQVVEPAELDPPAGWVAPPPSDDERRLGGQRLKKLDAYRKEWWTSADARRQVAAELDRVGVSAMPTLPPEGEMERIERDWKEWHERDAVDTRELNRLLDLLASKDKPLADRLRAEYAERRQKLFNEGYEKQKKK